MRAVFLTDSFSQELFNFFLGVRQCQHIVLGCCQDSGYVAFLEQYAADESVWKKVSLLEGSIVNPAMFALRFENVLRLDSIFAQQQAEQSPVAAKRVTGQSGPIHKNDAIDPNRLGRVLWNEKGERVDKTLNIDPDSGLLKALRGANLCSWYYLRGECRGCDRNHNHPPLTPREYEHLWYITRQNKCHKIKKGKACEDLKCVYGHQ